MKVLITANMRHVYLAGNEWGADAYVVAGSWGDAHAEYVDWRCEQGDRCDHGGAISDEVRTRQMMGELPSTCDCVMTDDGRFVWDLYLWVRQLALPVAQFMLVADDLDGGVVVPDPYEAWVLAQTQRHHAHLSLCRAAALLPVWTGRCHAGRAPFELVEWGHVESYRARPADDDPMGISASVDQIAGGGDDFAGPRVVECQGPHGTDVWCGRIYQIDPYDPDAVVWY